MNKVETSMMIIAAIILLLAGLFGSIIFIDGVRIGSDLMLSKGAIEIIAAQWSLIYWERMIRCQ